MNPPDCSTTDNTTERAATPDELASNPFLQNEFSIRWSLLVPERMEEGILTALQAAEAVVERLAGTPPATPTFANAVLALEDATRPLNLAWGKVEHLNSVANTPAFREIYARLLPRVTAFFTSVTLDPRLWAMLQRYAATAGAAALRGPEKRLLEEMLADFSENGANLDGVSKTRLGEINARLAELTQRYSENVLDATNAWSRLVNDAALLDGLPATALAAAADAATAAGSPGAWRFTLHAPSISPVLRYAKNEAFRRECWEAWAQIGGAGTAHDNTALAAEILALRHEKARLLGKESFADFAVARRMARNGDRALRFVEELHGRVQGRFLGEAAELEAFKAAATGGAGGPLAPWETGFWAERQRRALHDFDDEALRPYFPVGGVLEGMFALFGRLFGIRVADRTGTVETWHPEVRFYEVRDSATGVHLGSFYTDWFPRETKRGGAWMNHLITGGPRADGSRAPHLGLMCGNFSPPVGGGEPLLLHDEVLTIFHEFGHLLHHILSESPHEALAGTRVAWDFVELPSQLLENWCWHGEGLACFSRHHATGEPLPAALLQRLVAAKNFRAATAMMRQLAFGKLDLELHHHYPKTKDLEPDDLWNRELRDYQPPLSQATPSMARHFTHIFGDPLGYAAGYYSYKWAEVLEADVFTRFLREGLLNESTGRELREKIYAKGNTKPPEDLFRDFMGRDPDPSALLLRDGLADPPQA
ncbi:MAG: M3 family metallopeptidase [Puniceicoccales bacterium]|jgi:oligopeptidase A|nr:M3 family metallopeptidase [Puniceicoccales bacterium]